MTGVFAELRGRALWVVVACAICQLGLGFGYGMGAVAADILEEFGWSRALYSSAQGLQGVVVGLGSPLVGFAAARFGGRAVLSVGAVVTGLGFGLVASMHGWWQLLAGTTLASIGVVALGDITTGTLVTQWTRRSRGLMLGAVYTGSNLGGLLALNGMGLLADTWSWRHAVAGLVVASFGVLLPAAWFGVRDRRSAEPAPDAAASHDEPVDDVSLPVAAAVRTRSFWILAAALFGFWLYLFGMMGHFVLALMDEGFSRTRAAAYFSYAVAMGMVSKMAFGFLADRMRPKSSLLLDFGALALSSLFLLAIPGGAPAWAIWGFVVLFGFSYAARDVVTPLIAVHAFGPVNLAQLYGLLMLTILPGNYLGFVAPGWVFDRTGSYAGYFAGVAVLNAATLLLLTFVRDERRAVRA